MISKRKFKDTGYLTWTNSELTSNSLIVVTLDLRFEPYNDMKIVNLSTSDMEITINQHSIQVCPRGSEIQINQPIIKDIRIKNIGSDTATTKQIRVFYRNDGFEGKELVDSGLKILQVGALLLR